MRSGSQPPIVLAAHGSRNPASAATMRGLARRVGRVWPAPVTAAFLDFDRPSIPDALAALPDDPAPVVVPALLTDAYHGRVDLPGVLAAARGSARLARVLGPDPLLLAALRRRLSELDGRRVDGVVLVAAGTTDGVARSTVDATAGELGQALGVPIRVGYASAAGPTVGEAVVALRATGVDRVLVASYFLAPGLLHTAARHSALEAGAAGVAAPLGLAPELVRLVVARARAAQNAWEDTGPGSAAGGSRGHEKGPGGESGALFVRVWTADRKAGPTGSGRGPAGRRGA